ncbi:MAG: sugar phosphate nucleotidyltransferase, partial [Bacteroidota bacterium]
IEETKQLGTAGAVGNVDISQWEDFLVINADIITDLNFQALFDQHTRDQANLTVATYTRDTKIDFGVIEMDPENHHIIGFREKPIYSFIVSMGVYAMNRKVLHDVPDSAFGFDDLIHKLLEKKEQIHVFPYSGYWLDIGRPDDYEKANNDLPTIEGFL